MALKIVEKEISLTEDIPIIECIHNIEDIQLISYLKVYHVYKNVWTSPLQDNSMKKYAVAIKKMEK